MTDGEGEVGEPVSISRRIRELAEQRPDDDVYVHIGMDGGEPTFRWPELHCASSRLAGALAGRGLGLGDRLAIGLRNSPEFVVSVFAAWKLGATPVPVRWDLPDWELERVRAVVASKVYVGPDDLPWIRATGDHEVPDLPDVVAPRMFGICSSGSTGTPKVIVSALPALFDPLYSMPIAEMWHPVPRPQTVLALAPMYHVNAFSTLHSLLAGDRLVVMEKFDAGRIVEVIERYRVTTFTATPTMLQRIADLPGVDSRDLSSLEWILQGAAPMPPSLVHRWADLIGASKIIMAYGMTEAIGITALNGEEWLQHEGSVGRGMRDTEARILGEDGKDLPSREIGEIFMRSPAYGGSDYLGEAPQLRPTKDGFQTVGDMGYLDEDGYLYVVDRRVDMIITGGANVYPAEVENALIDHPKIADIVVIGLRDPEWGRRVHAIIEPADPADPPKSEEVIAYANSRLARYKVPKTIEIVDAIPRSEATKVNRGRLIEARGG
jgi:bile acid-coenzyme A ligase